MIPKPPNRLILTTPVHFWAFGFGSGLAPVAPGTFGTLVGLVFFLAIGWMPGEVYAGIVLALYFLGMYLCGASARLLHAHDYKGIVWDEIVGVLVALAPIVEGAVFRLEPEIPLWGWMAIGFAWFRLFDIVKPWPIRWIDRHIMGGGGIMLDDLIAGLYAGVLTFLTALGLSALLPLLLSAPPAS